MRYSHSMSRELRDFEQALKQSFLREYTEKVTRLAFNLFCPRTPLKREISQKQRKDIETFSHRFANVYDEVAKSCFSSTEILMFMNK